MTAMANSAPSSPSLEDAADRVADRRSLVLDAREPNPVADSCLQVEEGAI
jgi:hypothetical protein